MKNPLIVIITLISPLFFSCSEEQKPTPLKVINQPVIESEVNKLTCESLPNEYGNFDEAISKIKAYSFKINETINTSKSSWFRGASYYSCDGQTGFFIIKTDKKEYLYSNLPIAIWEEFKDAVSFGSYYDLNIKNKYQFILK